MNSLYYRFTPFTENEIYLILNKAQHLKTEGKFDMVEKLLYESLHFSKSFSNNTNIIQLIIYLAKFLFEQNKYSQAEPFFHEALIMLEQHDNFRSNYKNHSLGAYNDNVGYKFLLSLMKMYAIILHNNNKHFESELLFKEILKIKMHILKPIHNHIINESTLRSIVCVAKSLYFQKKYSEAVDYLLTSFKLMSKMYGTCHNETITINNYLCFSLQKLERFDEHDFWSDIGSINTEIPLIPFSI